ncbi:MAG TPA: glycosyltransferase family 1 protein [Edaphocola sp.]|nr:glycosyltransferase family 1 protein [Edaphocola sp.]
MNIGVNTRLFLKGRLEGIGWFMQETLKRIVASHPEHHFYFFFDRPFDDSFIFEKNVTPVVLSPQARHPVLFYIWFEWSITNALKKYKIDIFLSPDNFASLRTKVPTCLVIHDLAFEHFPQFVKKVDSFHYRKFMPKFAKKATRIVAVSEFTKLDIIQKYKILEDKIDVVHNGAHELYQPISFDEKEDIQNKYADGQQFFLFTGALHPRKNVINLLKAFVKFKRRLKSPMKMIIVGRMAWMAKDIQEAKNKMPFKEDVVWLGYVEVEELSKITAAAYAMVYPSLFEGFGIPILESLKSGVPAIASNTSSMPEVLGKAGLLVNPTDVDDIANAMMKMYKEENLRKEFIKEAFVQSQKFSWDKSAKLLYESIMKCVP